MEEGVHTIRVAAQDLAGNIDPSPEVLRVLVDMTPPESTPSGPPPLLVNSSTVALPVTASDDSSGSGVDYITVTATSVTGHRVNDTVDGATGSATLTGLTSGWYNVSTMAVDAAGNHEATPPWWWLRVDLDAPAAVFHGAVATCLLYTSDAADE